MTGRIVLAVDTSSPLASFALARGGKLIATLETDNQLPHSQTFFAHLQEVLSLAQISLSEVEILAGATGPGSFTGLRVGVAALKGLGQALNREVIGVNALDLTALAANAKGRFLVLLEAGRGEVFAGLRIVEPNGRIFPVGIDYACGLTAVVERFHLELEDGAILAGAGATKHVEELAVLAEKFGQMLSPVIDLKGQSDHQEHKRKKCWTYLTAINPLAPALAIYTTELLGSGYNPELRAYYLRVSDAELNLSFQR